MKILIIDNYDSFTYNIYQDVGVITGKEPIVYLNDQITVEQINKMNPDRIIISSGSGNPRKTENIGNCAKIIKNFYHQIPILGISMGNLIIAHNFNCKIRYSPNIQHGELITINSMHSELFDQVSDSFQAMAYYTFIIDRDGLPDNVEIIAESNNKTIMGIKVKGYPVYGVQFNPESLGTESGKNIFKNFINLDKLSHAQEGFAGISAVPHT